MWVATPAAAHPPARFRNLVPSHYNGQVGSPHNPNDTTFHATNEAQLASDRFDGRDNMWTMRAAASATALFYEWYLCDPDATTIWDPPGLCERIAIDTTPTLSQAPPGVGQVAVFQAEWDIPPDLPFDATFTIHVRTAACREGPPSDPAHCVADRISIHFDDSSPLRQSPHPPTTAGQIAEPLHGGVIGNAGFTAVALTSDDDIGRLQFCLSHSRPGGAPWHPANDANPRTNCDPGSTRDLEPNDSPACAAVPTGANCWEAVLNPPDNAEFLLGIVEQDDLTDPVESGDGDCEGDMVDGDDTGDDCQLDKIYLTSAPSPPPPGGGTPGGGTGTGTGTGSGSGGAPGATCPGFETDPRNQVVGGQGDDDLHGTPGPDVICGLGGHDVIQGLEGGDVLMGGGGNDRLKGSAGGDRLRGQADGDILAGGSQGDRLLGGPGGDRCAGGPGRDGFGGCERTPGGLDRPQRGRWWMGAV
jgi:RTX calcium-binding nonapeptide repeat (4 copies)